MQIFCIAWSLYLYPIVTSILGILNKNVTFAVSSRPKPRPAVIDSVRWRSLLRFPFPRSPRIVLWPIPLKPTQVPLSASKMLYCPVRDSYWWQFLINHIRSDQVWLQDARSLVPWVWSSLALAMLIHQKLVDVPCMHTLSLRLQRHIEGE